MFPLFAEPVLGAGMEYFVPRRRYWKFDLRWTCISGSEVEEALGEEMVTEARMREGFPHEGQNFLELSLQIL